MVLLAAVLCLVSPVYGRLEGETVSEAARREGADSAKRCVPVVSLITCAPGPEVYELCGHEAIRVRGCGIDSVWNYGMFSFNEPNFLYRFVKGETDYMLGAYPWQYFLPEYIAQNRRVTEQDLNLTPAETDSLIAMLRRESLPQNCRYRYNYVKDNCATRILERLDQASTSRIIYSDSTRYGTFRKEMRAYHRDYPWYQFGIDLALGSGLDYRLTGREEMFVPVELMRKAATARFADGRQLVRETRVLNEGIPDATLGPTPFWKGPLFWSFVVLAISAAVAVTGMLKRRLVLRIWYTLFFLLLGVAGCLSAFLVFVSVHEASSPNLWILWVNPLQLLMAIAVWSRKMRPVGLAVSVCDIVAAVCMSVAWPLQTQSADPAMFPLLWSSALLAGAYAIIGRNKSYKNMPGYTRQRPRPMGRNTSGRRKRNTK